MRFSKYSFVVEQDNALVMFNTKTTKYVRIHKEEEIKHFNHLCDLVSENPSNLPADDEMVKALYQNGYVVEDDLDEYKEVQQQISDYLGKYNSLLQIVLYVTEQCNFRCIYCPEDHVNKKFSEENWENLYKFIEKRISEDNVKTVTMSFFGGEPLLESKKMIEFLEKLDGLKSNYPDVEFKHQITTNGYLLTPEIYDKLVKYDLVNYQITVDGFADSHNKMRPRVDGEATWDKIIENLKYINTRDDNAEIDLRANFNHLNMDSIQEYKEWALKTFDNDKFKFNFHPVVNFSENVSDELLADQESEEYKALYERVNDYKDEKNVLYGKHIMRKFSGICKAAYPNILTISSEGKISKCENISIPRDQLFVGQLGNDGDIIYTENMDKWTKDFETEECPECLIYPICCARTCPAKKVICNGYRPDCDNMKKCFDEDMVRFVKNL